MFWVFSYFYYTALIGKKNIITVARRCANKLLTNSILRVKAKQLIIYLFIYLSFSLRN